MLIEPEVEENPVAPAAPPPSGSLETFDISTEGVGWQGVEHLQDAFAIPIRKLSEVSSRGVGYYERPVQHGVEPESHIHRA